MSPPKKKPVPATGQTDSKAAIKSSQRVTLRDIAKAVGVTPVSVSLAMRNSSRISEPMRQKIRALAEQMGYRPDPMLAALAHYRRGNVKSPVGAELAWINFWPDHKKLRSFKEFELYWAGAYEEAEKCGYRLEEFHWPDMSPGRLEQILLTRNIQGILLTPLPTDATQPDWQDFQWSKFCAVRFGYSIQNPRVHIVGSDQLANGLMACQSIHQQGYQRIGLVTRENTVVRFAAGYLYHQMRANPTGQPVPLKLQEASRANDRAELKAWLKKYRPDVIFSDCAQLRDLLTELNIRVPRDLSLASTSVLDGNSDAGIYQNSDEIGRAAVQLVISLIHHNDFGIPPVCREMLVEGRWQDGSALPPKP
jgi:LacI family transcriptional regulator